VKRILEHKNKNDLISTSTWENDPEDKCSTSNKNFPQIAQNFGIQGRQKTISIERNPNWIFIYGL
jgi:hypothetical protein